jgi:hypothetical protein
MQRKKYKENIEIDYRELPLLVKFKGRQCEKKYILKTNKEKSGIFLNKKEKY